MEGFVYALINPSLSGLVKVGRTTRSANERALELSSATGVPTPFVVAYEVYVSNSNEAEKFIHNILEYRGYRVADNREFFKVGMSEVVDIFTECQEKYKVCSKMELKDDSEYIIDNMLFQADCYHFGTEDTFQDIEEAKKIYKKAFNIGSYKAAYELAQISVNIEEKIYYLKKSIELNNKYIPYNELVKIISTDDYISEFSSYDDDQLLPSNMVDKLITPNIDYIDSHLELLSAYKSISNYNNVNISLKKILTIFKFSYEYMIELHRDYGESNIDNYYKYFFSNRNINPRKAKIFFQPIFKILCSASYFIANHIESYDTHNIDLKIKLSDMDILVDIITNNLNEAERKSINLSYDNYKKEVFGIFAYESLIKKEKNNDYINPVWIVFAIIF